MNWRRLVDPLFSRVPVLAPRGPLRGLWWSAYPWSAYWRGTYEPIITRELQSCLPGPGGVCWDIGSHFGYYAAIMARNCGRDGQVLALEPNPPVFHRLRRHQRLNRLAQLQCVCAAASNHNGRAMLFDYGDRLSTTAHLPFPDENVQVAPVQHPIELVRLDDLRRIRQLRAPHLVKLDVEGHGAAALDGMAATLAEARPVLFAAIHHRAERDGICQLLEPMGYRMRLAGQTSLTTPGPDFGDYIFTPRQTTHA